MSGAWSAGSTRQWRRVRAAVLAANQAEHDGRCALQLDGSRGCPRHPGRRCRGCTTQATAVHHVRGRANTGDAVGTLQAVCAWCNGHVGDPSDWPTVHRVVSRW